MTRRTLVIMARGTLRYLGMVNFGALPGDTGGLVALSTIATEMFDRAHAFMTDGTLRRQHRSVIKIRLGPALRGVAGGAVAGIIGMGGGARLL